MRTLRFLHAAALSLIVLGGAAAQEPENKPPQQEQPSPANQREKARKEMDEAANEIQAYSQARRDEAVERARLAMDRMDRQMQQLQADWDRAAESMSQAARANRDKAMSDLRRQRSELSARYRKLQDSSADIWAQVRDDFVSSYRRAAEALRKARSDYDEEQPEEGQREGEPKPAE